MYIINTKIILEHIEYACPNSVWVLNLSFILSPQLFLCILDLSRFSIFSGSGYTPRIIAILTKLDSRDLVLKCWLKCLKYSS